MKRQRLPLRKYLFYGLTLVLASVFIFLVIQGRRMEKERMQQGAEIVQNYTPSPTRVLSPGDLEILTASMIREQDTVRHRIEIKNSGKVSYSEVQLRLTYFTGGGEVIFTAPHSIKKVLLPGDTLIASDISIQDIPPEANECRAEIVFADIEPGE